MAFEREQVVFSELDFDDIQFYFESLMPALAEFEALEQILEFTRMGLGMAGDKNNDGRLEFCELQDYFGSIRGFCSTDKQLATGVKLLLNSYWTLAGSKGYISEEDLFARFYGVLSFMVVETLQRPRLVQVAGEKIEEVLTYELMRDLDKHTIAMLDQVNATLEDLKSPYRILLDPQNQVRIRTAPGS